IQAAMDETIAKGYSILRFGGKRYEIAFQTADLNAPTYDGPNVVSTSGFVRFSYLLKFGEQCAKGGTFTLLGEGGTIYTEEENADPVMLLVDAKFTALNVEGLNFERKCTTTRYPRPGDNPAIESQYGFSNVGINRIGVAIWPVPDQKPCAVSF